MRPYRWLVRLDELPDLLDEHLAPRLYGLEAPAVALPEHIQGRRAAACRGQPTLNRRMPTARPAIMSRFCAVI